MFDKIYSQSKSLGFVYHGNWYQSTYDRGDGSALQAEAIFVKD